MKSLSKHIIPTLSQPSYFIDTHCHLDMDSFAGDRAAVLTRAINNNVKKIISIAIDVRSSEAAINIARSTTQVSATIGIHPHEADQVSTKNYEQLTQLFTQHSSHISAYGEIGLDYCKKHSSPHNQKKHFIKQLDLARELQLPVIIHNRDADDDTLGILAGAEPFHNGGIVHCFSGDSEFASKVMDMGLTISIPGIVTFANATTLHEVVEKVPLTSLVLETDGPFLAPHPMRGKRNEPCYIPYIAQKIAKIKHISIEQVADVTTANAKRLFKDI